MRGTRPWRVALATLGLFLVLLPVALFHASSGEEGPFLAQIQLVADGLYPGRDFFSPYPFGFFAPYAAVARLLAPTIEAGRVLSALLAATTVALFWGMARQAWGGRWALAVVLALVTNVVWLISHLLILTTVVADLGLALAVFALAVPRRPGWRAFALAGLGLGVAINARLIMIPLVAVVPVLAALVARDEAGWRRRLVVGLGYCLSAGAAFLIPCLPDLGFLAAQPADFLFLKFGAFFEAFTEGGLSSPHPHGPGAGLAVFARYFVTGSHFSGPQALLVPIAAALLAVTVVLLRASGRPLLAAPPDRLTGLSLLVSLLFLLGYGLSPHTEPAHYRQVLPYLLLSLAGLARAVVDGRQGLAVVRWPAGMAALALLCSAVSGLVHAGWQVAFRHAPGIGQMTSTNALACWIESVAPPEAEIVSFLTLPVVQAGRRVPPGTETGANYFFWLKMKADSRSRYRLADPAALVAAVEGGRYSLVVDDRVADAGIERFLPGLRPALAGAYTLQGTVGNDWGSHAIWLSTRWQADHPPPPPLPRQRATANRELIRTAGWAAFAGALAADLANSLVTLPADLSRSLAWMTGASHDRRCAGLF